MHRNEPLEPREPINPWPILCGLVVIVGLVLFAVSFVWPGSSTRSAAWSTEQAIEYQSASEDLKRLTLEYGKAAESPGAQQLREELQKKEKEYAELHSDLESAIARPRRLAIFLRVGACLIVLVGAAGFFYSSRAHDN
jgi:cell division protein FtsL